MKRSTLMLAALTLLLGGVGQARADILYNNLPASPSGADGVAPPIQSIIGLGPLANSFSTGATAVTLSDVKLLLEISPPPAGSITVTLLSDASMNPGAFLTTIGTWSDGSLSDIPAVIDFPTTYNLAAHTRYWVQVSTSDESSAEWLFSFDTSGPGVANEFTANANGVVPNSEGPYQMEVIAVPTVSTPEPSSLTFLFLGSLGLLGYGWRRRRHEAAS